MTEVRYFDRDGAMALMQNMYETKPNRLDEKPRSWASISNEKEKELIEHVERNGGRVLSIVSQPISKRRYKRKVAKMIKRNEKIMQYNENN